MIEENNLETYLYISKDKFGIYIINKSNFKNLYKNEVNFNDDFLNLNNLEQFLDDNIFKIEKFIGKFIKNIFIVIDDKKILDVSICVKNKNFVKDNNKNYLNNTLRETKELYNKYYPDEKIMHMLVDSYLIDGKNYNYFAKELIFKEFSLIVNFISISNNFSKQIEQILEKYQIKINKFIYEAYVKNYFKEKKIEFPLMICKILNGYNKNEVQLVAKNHTKKGFFEKFFQLFG